MRKKIDIKKELSEEEFKNIILRCEEDFVAHNTLVAIARKCEEAAKEITPAKEAQLLVVKPEEKRFEVVTRQESVPFIEGESLLMEAYRTKQPLLINDVTRSFLYKEEIDNFLGMKIKDLMLIPVVDESEDRKVIAILWAAIPVGSWNQYTQKDLDYMSRFAMLSKRFLSDQHPKSPDNLMEMNMQECAKTCDQLRQKIEKEQHYFSSIIHDIRTPMNAVMGFLELLNLIETDEEKKDYLDTAIRSGKSMVTLINDALDLAKIASGQMRVEKHPFSPLSELDDTAKLFHSTTRTKGIDFRAYFDPHIPEKIVSDPHRIKQIINNLLSNAVKFTPKGGSVTLELLYRSDIDGLCVNVIDTGIGIDPERQKEIFTPFVQERDSTSRQYGGTGLGLSISQQLAVLLGGKLQMESEPGKGSRFYFTIPCNTPESTPPSIDLEAYTGIKVRLYTPGGEAAKLEEILRYLRESPMEIATVDTPEALSALKKQDPALLILPKEEAVIQRKQVQKLIDAGTPVLIVGDNFLNMDCQFDGRVERISAPYLPHELFGRLSLLLELDANKKRLAPTKQSIKKFDGRKVLVVDDNLINLKFMKEVLKRMDLEVHTAQNGAECLERLRHEPVDLVFMDENMPEMSGTEVIQKIRQNATESTQNTPIPLIGLTGNADKKTKETLLKAGADDVLTKPISLQKIFEVAQRYL